MQETNQWATDCSLSLRDGPWQKKKKKPVGPPGKCPVCPITSPALLTTKNTLEVSKEVTSLETFFPSESRAASLPIEAR